MKQLCLIIWGLMLGLGVYGQDTLDVFTYGGEGEDDCKRILEWGDGYLLIGNTSSFGNGPSDVYIVHVDHDFGFIESKTVGSYDVDGMYDAALTEEGLVIVGYTNSEEPGRYVGVVWKLDSSLNTIQSKVLDFGEITIPTKILHSNDQLLIHGSVSSGSEQSFVVSIDAQTLNQNFLKTFAYSDLRTVEDWTMVGDSVLVASILELGSDSVGKLTYFDASWNEIDSRVFDDSIGVIRDIRLLPDSALLLVGDKIDSIYELPIGSVAKIAQDLGSTLWTSEFKFAQAFFVHGVQGQVLSNGRLVFTANTNYLESVEEISVIAAELDSVGNFISGAGFYYGSFETDRVNDTYLNSGDTLYLVGTSDGYGVGRKDFYVLQLHVRSSNFKFKEHAYLDDKIKSLSVLERKKEMGLNPQGVIINTYWSQPDNHEKVRLLDLNGREIKVFFADQTIHFNFLPNGIYLLESKSFHQKLIVQP